MCVPRLAGGSQPRRDAAIQANSQQSYREGIIAGKRARFTGRGVVAEQVGDRQGERGAGARPSAEKSPQTASYRKRGAVALPCASPNTPCSCSNGSSEGKPI